MSDKAQAPRPFSLRPVVDRELDADTAWLRASVEAFEPRLRELEARGTEDAAAGAWEERPDLGCGYGCRACPPRLPGRTVLDLERWWTAPLRRRDDLTLRHRLHQAAGAGEPVVLGASADPYAGGAARRSRTRRLLEGLRDDAFPSVEGAEILITTASPLVLCDLELLVELDRTSSLSVEMVLPTADPELARRLEPGAAGPGERLGALAEIAALGVATRVRVAPLLPGLNQGEAALRPLLAAAAESGAVDVAANPLHLPLPWTPGAWRARRRFVSWLSRHEPELVPRYRRLYRLRRTPAAVERSALLADFERLRLELGFPRGVPARG